MSNEWNPLFSILLDMKTTPRPKDTPYCILPETVMMYDDCAYYFKCKSEQDYDEWYDTNFSTKFPFSERHKKEAFNWHDEEDYIYLFVGFIKCYNKDISMRQHLPIKSQKWFSLWMTGK